MLIKEEKSLTVTRVAELSTGYVSINLTPVIITDSSPLLIQAYFHTATVIASTSRGDESDFSILANGYGYDRLRLLLLKLLTTVPGGLHLENGTCGDNIVIL